MSHVQDVLDQLHNEYPNSPEYHQAAKGIAEQVVDLVHMNEHYKSHKVLERLLRPERMLSFTIEWEDDDGDVQFNRAYRIQHSQLLGPYKGGLRFHPSVNQSILQFLALEQSVKNALSGEALGAGKGGADFNPKNHSENEIRRFSRAFAEQLADHIGSDLDVPAGDIGVSSREIAWMYGKLNKIQRSFDASLTGKPPFLAGSHMREQATGYGVIFLLVDVLNSMNKSLENMRVAVSGAGNVAIHAAEQAIKQNAKVISLSNSRGCLCVEDGLTANHIGTLRGLSTSENSLAELAKTEGFDYLEGKTPWHLDADIYVPCATQNEIDSEAAKQISKNSDSIVIEGANMPCTADAEAVFKNNGVLRIPGKAANAGGVILSSFEIQQQLARRYESSETLEKRLQQKMADIHQKCLHEIKATQLDMSDYDTAATRAGFRRLADAMLVAGY